MFQNYQLTFRTALTRTLVFFSKTMATSQVNPSVSMSLQIQVGFNPITFESFGFRDSSLKKGRNLKDANHVFNVIETRKPGKLPEISARCVRQTNISSDAYFLTIQLDSNRSIDSARCNCTGGISGECKHVAGKIID